LNLSDQLLIVRYLACADHRVVIVVSVENNVVGGANNVQRKPHDHFSWGGLLRGVELASIDVLVIQTHSLRERKLTDLLHRLETLGVSFELIGQTGGFGGKLSRHEPNTRSKLVPLKAGHGGKVWTLAREIFVRLDCGEEREEERSDLHHDPLARETGRKLTGLPALIGKR